MSDFISPSWLKPLFKALRSIRGEREKEIVRIRDTFGDPYALAKYYVQPDCQHHNPADHFEDEMPRSAVTSPVFKTINEFLKGDFAIQPDGRNQMFVLSDAGMGKTSLLMMLRLTHLTRFWPQSTRCELMRIGDRTIEDVTKLEDRGNTVLLLDALDEDPGAWRNTRGRLIDLLSQTANFRRVILSCRTQFFPETSEDPYGNPGRVELEPFVCPIIYLSPFDDLHVEEYLDKRFPDRWYRLFRETRLKARARVLVKQMTSLRCRPMLLSRVEDVLASAERNWTEYNLYEAMLQAWLNREVQKLINQGRKDVSRATLETATSELAVAMQTRGVRFLSNKELDEFVVRLPAAAQLREIHFGGKSFLNRSANGDYRFAHFSIQEFLVAKKLLGAGKSEGIIRFTARPTEKVVDFVVRGRTHECPDARIDMSGLDLSKMNFSGADLRNIDFSNANLSQANLEGATLRECKLGGASFIRARTAKANIRTELPVPGLDWICQIDRGAQMALLWVDAGDFKLDGKILVKISEGFWIGKFPVTQAQYEAGVGSNPSHFKQSGQEAPVETLSWEEARIFCDKVQRLPQIRDTTPKGYELRLPTEAEWEYACRAGSTTDYCYGDDPRELSEYAWFSENSRKSTHPVGQKKPNKWGLYDMHGNVWEWCQDWYGEYPKEPVTDPKGPKGGSSRVFRGGGWLDSAGYCRSALRNWDGPSLQYDNVGFRVVLARSSVQGPEQE